MKKIKVLFIKFMADRYGSGLSNFQLKTLKQAHQCDLVLGVPVSQPLKGVEYPYFEIKEFDVKEQSFVDSYENEIESLEDRIKDQTTQIHTLKWTESNKVDRFYKVSFWICFVLMITTSVILGATLSS